MFCDLDSCTLAFIFHHYKRDSYGGMCFILRWSVLYSKKINLEVICLLDEWRANPKGGRIICRLFLFYFHQHLFKHLLFARHYGRDCRKKKDEGDVILTFEALIVTHAW